jgi:hypothetical protein
VPDPDEGALVIVVLGKTRQEPAGPSKLTYIMPW